MDLGDCGTAPCRRRLARGFLSSGRGWNAYECQGAFGGAAMRDFIGEI